MFPSTPSPMDQIVQAKLTFPKTRPTTQTWSKHIGRLWISTPTSQSRRYTRTRTRCGATTGALACMSTVRRQLQRLVLDVEDLPAQRGTTIAKTFGSTSWRLATECTVATPLTASTGTTTMCKGIARFLHPAIQSTGFFGIGTGLVLNSPKRSTACQTTRLPLVI